MDGFSGEYLYTNGNPPQTEAMVDRGGGVIGHPGTKEYFGRLKYAKRLRS
jgi:hypothetical protein